MTELRVNHLSFQYEKQTPVLKGISFVAKQRESVGIVGANGAGKSTLLRLLVGLNLNYEGEIRVDEQLLAKDTLTDIRKKVGYVFQDSDSQLFMSTAYEDIAFGPRNYGYSEQEVNERVEHAMELTGCSHLRDKQIYKMSGGEKKMVSIATILSLTPEIILMDEPSAALDPRNRRNLIRLLHSFDCLKLIASHDLDMIWDTCERTILVSDGMVVRDGDTKEILTDEKLLTEHGLELPLSARIREQMTELPEECGR